MAAGQLGGGRGRGKRRRPRRRRLAAARTMPGEASGIAIAAQDRVVDAQQPMRRSAQAGTGCPHRYSGAGEAVAAHG